MGGCAVHRSSRSRPGRYAADCQSFYPSYRGRWSSCAAVPVRGRGAQFSPLAVGLRLLPRPLPGTCSGPRRSLYGHSSPGPGNCEACGRRRFPLELKAATSETPWTRIGECSHPLQEAARTSPAYPSFAYDYLLRLGRWRLPDCRVRLDFIQPRTEVGVRLEHPSAPAFRSGRRPSRTI